MFFNESNGFAVSVIGSLDESSVLTLYPEYFEKYQKTNSATYDRWEKEKDSISKSEFAKREGISDFSKTVKKEDAAYHRKLDEELQEKFNAFVASHKDEIYQKQIKAIKKNKEAEAQYQKDMLEYCRKNYESSMLAYKSGNEVVVKLDDIELINKILSIGYKVKSFYNNICCLEYGKGSPLAWEDIETVFPFVPSNYDYAMGTGGNKRPRRSYFNAVVEGVSFDPDMKLLGYEYPDINNDDILGW